MALLMDPVKRTLSSIFFIIHRKRQLDRRDFILYKIVDSSLLNDNEYYKIQCINTKATFSATIQDLVFDQDILYGFHPIQGCYIGINYARVLRSASEKTGDLDPQKNILSQYTISRYGHYSLQYQNRGGHLCFESKENGQQWLMDPRDIALSRELIEEFDVVEAFWIGVLAGLKSTTPASRGEVVIKRTKADLRLVP